jgi:hypothetical protein
MAQLITDLSGVQGLKRALNRFKTLMSYSEELDANTLALVSKITSLSGHLSTLFKASTKYDSFVKSLQCCTTTPPSVGCDCNGQSTYCKPNCCNPCPSGPTVNELFTVTNILKDNQNALLGLHSEINELVKAIMNSYSGDLCTKIPCDNELNELIADLICCNRSLSCGDCDEIEKGYPIALIVLVSLIFSGQYDKVSCLVCSTSPQGCTFGSGNWQQPPPCPCDTPCQTVDPCAPVCPSSLYELSISGLQYILSLDNQDQINRWFTIVGWQIGSIARQL